MKNLKIWSLAVAMLMVVTGCGENTGTGDTFKPGDVSKIVNEWQLTEWGGAEARFDVYVKFDGANMELYQRFGSEYEKYEGTYTLEGNTLYGAYTDGKGFGPYEAEVSADGKTMRLTKDDVMGVYTATTIPAWVKEQAVVGGATEDDEKDPEGDNNGNEGTGNEGTGNEGTGNEGTGNEGTGNEGTGNEGTGNEGTGNEGTGNEGTGNEGTGNEGTGNEGTGNEGTGNEGTGNEGTGNEGGNTDDNKDPEGGNTGNEGTGNEGTGNEGAGNEGTGNEGTGNEGTGNEGTGTDNGSTTDPNAPTTPEDTTTPEENPTPETNACGVVGVPFL